MKQRISIKTDILKFGLLQGITTIIYSFSIYVRGNFAKINTSHATIFLLILACWIMIGMIKFKKTNDNYISLGEALKIGIGITVFGGFLAILWKILLIHVIDPDIITQLEEKQINYMIKNSDDFTQENIDRRVALTRKYTSPLIQIGAAILESLFLGFIISLVGGFIIRKKKIPIK
ncbi:DUF4199 domain-containing protein [uncultured Aquimarina sp.]|uniref:DUF4199 domain-containing protein n=1 Tax=uncultured Aquimarina sp. TaxID=575652 RepID=UPI00262B99F6|nr:DUF4199 domain-containing protein [uncultured Aquimarina sp.]